MRIDAIVLAGGRSTRLGSVPKSGLVYRRRSLLEHAVAAVRFARRTVVVGDAQALAAQAVTAQAVLITRENPPFGGPAAGIGAGLSALAASVPVPSDYTIVLACDMPRIEGAAARLLELLPQHVDADGIIARDAHRLQPLAAVYRTSALVAAVAEARRSGGLDGLSVSQLIAGLDLAPVDVPPGSTEDIDTWADAARFGLRTPDTLSISREQP